MAQVILVVALAWWGHSERGAWEGRRQVAAEGALEKGHRRNGLDTLSPFTCSVEWAMQAEPWRTVYWRCSCSRRARLLRPSLMTAAVLVLVVARHSGASTLTEALVAVAVAVAAAAAGGGPLRRRPRPRQGKEGKQLLPEEGAACGSMGRSFSCRSR